MIPANTSHRKFEATKLMVIHSSEVTHTRVGNLPQLLQPGDLLVVNRSGTLPSSFQGIIRRSQNPVEIRLAAFRGQNLGDLSQWMAISFGHGDWRMPTERRGIAPDLKPGDEIQINKNLKIRIKDLDPQFPRLLQIEFVSPNLIANLYREGKPIQYSYLTEQLQVWDQQTLFSGPPISVEPPSAAFPLNWGQILELKQRGISIATVLHGAGMSSTGDEALDQRLPLKEYFEVPESTVLAVSRAKAQGKRVVALGTTVTRALESAARMGNLQATNGYTDLKIGRQTQLKVVDALLTGMHESGTSHAHLMQAFCGCDILSKADSDAERLRYRAHEYGDLALLDCRRSNAAI